MKKAVLILFLSVSAVFLLSFSVSANEYYDFSELKESVSEDIFESMTDDTRAAFNALGISDLSFDKLYKVSLKSLLTYFTPEIKDKLKNVFSSFFELFSTVLILSAFGVLTQGGGINNTLMLFGSAVIVLLTFGNISDVINSCLSVIKLSAGFMASYVPVFTLIISFSGNPASALVYNSFVLGLTEVMSVVIGGGLVDFIGCFLCLAISFSFNEILNTNKLINVANKITTIVLGISGSLFSGILTVKNIMAVSLDGLSVKGVRFLLSSFIPVIGSSISEAYSSVLGSINLIKGSVAAIGILAVVIINLPVIVEASMYYFSLSALSYIAEITGCNQISILFRAICCSVRIMLLIVIFQMFLLVISTGIMLTFRS